MVTKWIRFFYRCVARAGKKRFPLITTKKRLLPSAVDEERAKIVKSKKIRLLDGAKPRSPRNCAKKVETVGAPPAVATSSIVTGEMYVVQINGSTGAVAVADDRRLSATPCTAAASNATAEEMVVGGRTQKEADSAVDRRPQRRSSTGDGFRRPVCAHCGYSCRRKYDMQRHIVSVHLPKLDSTEKLTCGVCWRNFMSKATLRRHVANAHFTGEPRSAAASRSWTRGFCCDICGRGYQTQRHMMAHRDLLHSSALPMRWSAFKASKGKLRPCAKCGRCYRDGRFAEEHECAKDDGQSAEEKQLDEFARARPRYRCDVCSVCFVWKLVFRQHREVSHPQAEPIEWDEVNAAEISHYCRCCCVGFDREGDLAGHKCVAVELETQPKSHVCEICGGSYQRQSDYRRHLRFKHSLPDPDGRENAAAMAGQSKEGESPKPHIKCPFCEGTTMTTRSLILAHIKEVHGIETDSPFVCVVCNKIFKRKSTLAAHNQIYHPQDENTAENDQILRENEILLNGETVYHCHMCNRNILNAVQFLAHHRLHFVERKFTCDLCGKQTRTQHQLNSHIRNLHLNIRNFECDICRKSFHSRQSCAEHRRIHTGERPFSCEICGKTFIALNALLTHKKFHDDFFPHSCHMCPKKFKVRRSLTNHIRTHTGERPYKCELCSKTFNNSSRFSYHKKVTHSDNRPYRCSLCGSCFKANKFLIRHTKLHKTRTHIQFRRRNNPAYFAAASGSNDSREAAAVANEQLQLTSTEAELDVGNGVAVKSETEPAATDVTRKTVDVNVSFQLGRNGSLIKNDDGSFGAEAATVAPHHFS